MGTQFAHNTDSMMTTGEVAGLARVDNSTVRRWVDKGELRPAMRLPGGHYRFAASEVERMLGLEPGALTAAEVSQ